MYELAEMNYCVMPILIRLFSIGRQIVICIKCGSDDVNRDKDELVCKNCGVVLFYSHDT